MSLDRDGRIAARNLARVLRRKIESRVEPAVVQGTVVGDDHGTAFVHIDGSDIPYTPVDKTIAVSNGDRVTVRIDNHRAYISGNATAPPTDDTTALRMQSRLDAVGGRVEAIEGDYVNATELTQTADAITAIAEQKVAIGDSNITTMDTIAQLTPAGLDIYSSQTSGKVHIDSDSVDVIKDDQNYTSHQADGLHVVSGGSDVAQFGDTVTIGRESELHTVMESYATRYIDAEGSTVLRLDKDTYMRRVKSIDGTEAYTATGETLALSPSRSWWVLDSELLEVDSAQLVLKARHAPMSADSSVVESIEDWCDAGMPGTLALRVPDYIIRTFGTGTALPVASILLDFSGFSEQVKFMSSVTPNCVYIEDPYIRITGRSYSDFLQEVYTDLFWVNPYHYSNTGYVLDDSRSSFAASRAYMAHADSDGKVISDTYVKWSNVEGYVREDDNALVTNAGVYRALQGKQDALNFDTTPTSGSNNPVTSGGVYTALASKAEAVGIPFGRVDSTSTATAFTATVPGITELRDGVSVMLENGVVTSAAGFTIDVNGLGAKPVYSNMSASQETTIFNAAYTMLFVYDSQLDVDGGWICYRGYDSNTNTIGYQLRTNSANMPAVQTGYRYRLWLTDADGKGWVPINTSTYTNATTARALNTRPIDPFGRIVYCSHNATKSAGSGLGATYQWDQYTLTIGYSYVITLTAGDPVYLKCAPQPDGSAVMESIVQALPSTDDGKIYIFLGTAYSTTAIELMPVHPVYWNDGTGVRVWTAVERLGEAEINELFAAAI